MINNQEKKQTIELAFQMTLILELKVNDLKMTMTNILKKLEKEWKNW